MVLNWSLSERTTTNDFLEQLSKAEQTTFTRAVYQFKIKKKYFIGMFMLQAVESGSGSPYQGELLLMTSPDDLLKHTS